MKDAEEIVVGANGSVLVAPPGSPIPDTVEEPLSGSWVDTGYITEDGATWTDGKTVKPIRAWQEFYDLLEIIESREAMLVFALMQWSGSNVKLAYGGGQITSPEPGFYRYEPPDPQEIDFRMMALEWQFGEHDFRLVFKRGLVTEKVDTKIVRTDAGLLPITFKLLGTAGQKPYVLDTNHPAFADAVGSGS